jgi:hypothetical protein
VSTIASTASSSAYAAALARLLGNTDSSTTSNLVQASQATAETSSHTSPSNPTDILDLSDRAKAMLERASANKLADEKLDAFLQATRNSGDVQGSIAPPSSFDLLSNLGQQGNSTWDPTTYIDNPGAYQQEQQGAHTRADGTIQSWSTSASDVFNVPSTPQDIDQWYQTQGQQVLALAQAFPDSMPGLAQAIQNRTVTFSDARDIPGLNFQNSFSFQGGENGSGGSEMTSFNSSLPIFQDTNVHYQIMGDGTVISWKIPAASQTAAPAS